jgi:hypothetical protein
MKIMEITPCIPLTLRGRFRESSYFKGDNEVGNPYLKGEI